MTAARIAVLLSLAIPAAADPVHLKLEHEPTPHSMRMRRPVAAVQPVAPRPHPVMPAAPVTPPIGEAAPEIEDLEGLRDVHSPVSASLTMGYQVDGARPSGDLTLAHQPVTEGSDYAKLRSYGFGEGFLSTRGMGVSSLETYFAVRFQAARTISFAPDPAAPENRVLVPSPIATWFERSGFELRSGWLETKDFLPKQWGLSKLRVRGGSQFVYGPWILHLDGANVAYEGPMVNASVYSGYRHSDYTRDQSPDRPLATGASVRIDLRGLTNAVPITIGGEYLGLTRSADTGQEAVKAEVLEVDWRPRRDFVVIGQLRGVDGEQANRHVEIRTRYKQVTNLVFDIMQRFAADWRWDPSLARPSSPTLGDATGEIAQSLDARRYLDLGPVLPQVIASARAGTLIRENIDLLARVAFATDHVGNLNKQSTSFSAPYVEIGGAVEIKLRRQVALGFSILSRQTNRDLVAEGDRIIDRRPDQRPELPDAPVPDPALNQLGEQGFTEIGSTLKMTLGARKFSALVEAYGRNTRYSVLYTDASPISDPVPDQDVRIGGRFTVDAWVSRKVRLFASYDVSSQLSTAPEISGYKSLRLTVTGTY